MSLKVELKPGERIIIGTAVVRNSDQRVRFFIEGDAPILREKDILTPSSATTPARKVYLAVQLLYLSGELDGSSYPELVRDFLEAAPSSLPIVEQINNEVLSGELYKALRTAKKLIAYERELFDHVSRGSERLRKGREDGPIAA